MTLAAIPVPSWVGQHLEGGVPSAARASLGYDAPRMAHCLVCGSEVPWPPPATADAGAAPPAVCSRCGTPFMAPSASHRPQRTLLGGVDVPNAARAPQRPDPAQRTLMGIAAPFGDVPASVRGPIAQGGAVQEQGIGRTQVIGTPRAAYDPITDPNSNAPTIVDVPSFAKEIDGTHGLSGTLRLKVEPGPAAGAPPSRSGGTLLGVARPGIAPLRPGVQKAPVATEEAPPPSYRPLEELGATQHVARLEKRDLPRGKAELAHPLGKRRFDKAIRIDHPRRDRRAPAPPASRRAFWLLLLAPVLVVGAIATVLLWPSAPPLKAQVRGAEGGAEVLDVTCDSCPDGTLLTVRDAEAKITGGKATVPLLAPLAIGDTALTVRVDRPGSGRDEDVALKVRVAYRIRPDLTTLEADRPSLQIVIEAMDGATVSLDGEDVPLRGGHAVKTIDITKDVTGPASDGGAQLGRRISYVVKPPDGAEEKGVVAVSIPVVPLVIDAPGKAIVTEKATFLLSGHTSPGAEIVVAGRSLGITKDGAFSQTMNVSSVGATEIEVRAKTQGRAPRLVHVAVERVTSIDSAIEAFQKRAPLDFAAVSKSIDAAVGKPIALSGEVLDVRSQGGVNTIVLRADSPTCGPTGPACVARLVQGRTDLGIDRSAKIRAFGFVVGPVQYEGKTTFDVDVAFAIVDKPPASPPDKPKGGE